MHDVQVLGEDSDVLAEGTFRVVLTRGRRVIIAIDAPDSALGPLHLVFAVSRESMVASTFATGSLFGDIGHTFDHVAHDVGHGLGKAAEGTFNAASKVATTLARPAFDITRDAAAAGASLIAHVPLVPSSERKKLEAASRTIMRARLGDVNAQQFIHAVGQAAKAGEKVAQRAGDALLDGTMIVARVLDTPLSLVSKIPKVGGFLHELDPLVKLDHMADKLKKGDFQGLKTMIENDAKMAQGVISLIPGIGTGISAAISAGVGILDGGGALDIAIETAYGAIPIPPGIREVTDAVLGAVLHLIHNPHNLTDALLAGVRNAVPAGMARDVFDTLANLVVKHMPIAKAGGELVDSYVQRYAPGIPLQGVGEALGNAADAAAHHKNIAAVLSGAVGDVAKKSAPGALGEGIAGAAGIVSAVAQKKNVAAAVTDAVGDAARKVAPGALGEGLATAASVAGAVAQRKNVALAVGDAAGNLARKVAPGTAGEVLAAGAQIAGAAGAGKNAFAAAGDAARRIAPGVAGQGLGAAADVASAVSSGKDALRAVSSVVIRRIPGAAGDAVAKYLPGVSQAAPFAAASVQTKPRPVAVPLVSSFAAAPLLLGAGKAGGIPLLPAAPGAGLAIAARVTGAAHEGSVDPIGDAVKGLASVAPGAAAVATTQAVVGGAGAVAPVAPAVPRPADVLAAISRQS
jgi:hypothetical protein